jgi:hypothetical protein
MGDKDWCDISITTIQTAQNSTPQTSDHTLHNKRIQYKEAVFPTPPHS